MIELLNCDCMEYMKTLEDNAFDLAIVDPPYGAGDLLKHSQRTTKKHKEINWNVAPSAEYFDELFRVSKNQIIWGANYFPQFFKSSKGWIFWDKLYQNTFNFSAGELAYTSFDKVLRMFRCSNRLLPNPNAPVNIHPCQKPVKLYDWVLKNYAKEGDRILDTHLGSGSSAIAAHYAGYDFVGCELDKDYYEAAQARFNEETKQKELCL